MVGLYSSVFVLYLQSEFCGDKPKSGAKYGLPESLSILSEMGEVTDGVMDNKVNLDFSHIYSYLTQRHLGISFHDSEQNFRIFFVISFSLQ